MNAAPDASGAPPAAPAAARPRETVPPTPDIRTADAFAASWNDQHASSVYTRANLAHLPAGMLELRRADLTKIDVGRFDYVYCIGVLHHLEVSEEGFRAVFRRTRPGGHFHCSVYVEEGNAVVIRLVGPLRRVVSRFPWWLTTYGVALPLAVRFLAHARSLRHMQRGLAERFGSSCRWIGERELGFAHHVAFDRLVTPQTSYISRAKIEVWHRHPDVDRASVYILQRNGNSWKFGGRRREAA